MAKTHWVISGAGFEENSPLADCNEKFEQTESHKEDDVNIVEYIEKVCNFPLLDYQKDFVRKVYDAAKNDKRLYYIPPRGSNRFSFELLQAIVLITIAQERELLDKNLLTTIVLRRHFQNHFLMSEKRKEIRRVMKEILIIVINYEQCSEWVRYLTKNIPLTMLNKRRRPLAIDMLADNYNIFIRPNSESCYRGRRPDYHYAYELEVNSNLLSTGSKQLNYLDDVIDIVKGEFDETNN